MTLQDKTWPPSGVASEPRHGKGSLLQPAAPSGAKNGWERSTWWRIALGFCLVFWAVVAAASAAVAFGATTNYAFGDSYVSGYGLAPLANATAQDTQCGRSSQSFSALATLQAGVVNRNFSCAGAKVADVYGQLNQSKAYGRPDYITISAGANDLDSGLNDCMAYPDCGGPAKEQQIQLATAAFGTSFRKLLVSVAGLGARRQVLVVGYPSLFNGDVACAAPYGITAAEAATVDRRYAAMSQAMKNAAVGLGTFVPVSFGNQGICTLDGPLITSGYGWGHPSLKGQWIVANAVLGAAR